MENCRVLVIEDHILVREALVSALGQLGFPCEFSVASCGKDALAMIEDSKEFDLVLVDLMLPDMSGFSLVSILAHRFPAVPVVVVSALADEASVKRALKAGAAGFLSKSMSSDQLVESIHTLLAGGVVVTEGGSTPVSSAARHGKRRSMESAAEHFGLTAAQTRVMELMVEGRTNREIADLLGLAEGTIKVHCSAILRALGVPNRAQALVLLARQGVRG
ncbi:response regulator [Uliginosibacterium gangwonense]|uniref:response regulator n=1 Tax=Uliginosibacterium gangwonense TaxID=392736 RepID=UPI000374520A|nr:response regulator transcription factor [Uliginosibacterium gangwonense]